MKETNEHKVVFALFRTSGNYLGPWRTGQSIQPIIAWSLVRILSSPLNISMYYYKAARNKEMNDCEFTLNFEPLLAP